MRFSLNIETGNATFDDDDAGAVVADMLSNVADMLREGYTSGPLRDPASNGPAVGSWTLDGTR
jgi:hypothetical protein